VADHGFAASDFPAIVAHRGASSTRPENTLPSFDAALDLGAPIVELDVRLSADGVAVVMHDPSVDRTTNGEGFVHEMTADALARLNAGSSEYPAGVPTLAEVLQLVSGRGAVALEIKNIPGEPAYDPEEEPMVEAALEEVERTRFAGGVLVLSFNPRSIAAAKRIAPRTPTGFLTTELVPPTDALAHAVESGHDLVLPGNRSLLPVGEPFVRAAHDAGVQVGTWTADDPETVRTLLRWGVDAIASNDPAMALGVLTELA
jgi:glycerophosphoryl diester phosphodiesterase